MLLQLNVIQSRDLHTLSVVRVGLATEQRMHCSVAVAILPTSMAERADAKTSASQAVSRIWSGGFFASSPRYVLCKPEAPSRN